MQKIIFFDPTKNHRLGHMSISMPSPADTFTVIPGCNILQPEQIEMLKSHPSTENLWALGALRELCDFDGDYTSLSQDDAAIVARGIYSQSTLEQWHWDEKRLLIKGYLEAQISWLKLGKIPYAFDPNKHGAIADLHICEIFEKNFAPGWSNRDKSLAA